MPLQDWKVELSKRGWESWDCFLVLTTVDVDCITHIFLEYAITIFKIVKDEKRLWKRKRNDKMQSLTIH